MLLVNVLEVSIFKKYMVREGSIMRSTSVTDGTTEFSQVLVLGLASGIAITVSFLEMT